MTSEQNSRCRPFNLYSSSSSPPPISKAPLLCFMASQLVTRRKGNSSLVQYSSLDLVCLCLVHINLLTKLDNFFLGSYYITCDDFNDCWDKVIISAVDFIGRRPILGHYLQRSRCSQALSTDIVTLGHRTHHRWLWRGNRISNVANQGLEVMNLESMQLQMFFYRFRCILGSFQNVGFCCMSIFLGDLPLNLT